MNDPGYVEVFNSIAEVYDKKYGKGCQYAQDLIFEYSNNLKLNPQTILDIGCGTGSLLYTASQVWPKSELFGIDPAIKMLEKAQEKIPKAKLSSHKVENIPLEKDSVDLVISTSSFAHWTSQRVGLDEISRILSPKGHCIIVEHARPNFLIRIFFLMINRMANFPELNQARELIENAGLQLIRLEKIKSYLLIHFMRKS